MSVISAKSHVSTPKPSTTAPQTPETEFDKAFAALPAVRLGNEVARQLEAFQTRFDAPKAADGRPLHSRTDRLIADDVKAIRAILSGSGSANEKLKQVVEKVTGFGAPTPDAHLRATPAQKLAAYGALFGVGANFALAAAATHSPEVAALNLAATVGGFVAADYATALVHHALDNYGNKDTKLWGKTIETFQWHHIDQIAETRTDFAASAARPALGSLVPLAASLAATAVGGPAPVAAFTGMLGLGAVMTTENHKMAHLDPKAVPTLYKLAQRHGLSLPRDDDGSVDGTAPGQGGHRGHHQSPHDGNYALLNGKANAVLDQGFFRWWEKVIYDVTGAEPNTWKLSPQKKIESLGLERGYDPAAVRALEAKHQLIDDTKGTVGAAEIARLVEVFPSLQQRDGAWVFTDEQSRNDNKNEPVALLDDKGRLSRESKLRLLELIPDKSKFVEPETVDWA
jgi:hypothetical protein